MNYKHQIVGMTLSECLKCDQYVETQSQGYDKPYLVVCGKQTCKNEE